MQEDKNFSVENSDLSDFEIVGAAGSAKKKRKHIWLFALLGFFVVLIVAALIAYSLCMADYNGTFRNGDTVSFEIPIGSSVSQIANILEDAGAIDNALLFRVYSRLADTEDDYQYGYFEFKNDIGFEAIAEILITQGHKEPTILVTIPEGTTIADYTKNVNNKDVTIPGIATLLKKAGVCQEEDFYAALDEVNLEGRVLGSVDAENTYYPLEGYLFPDTYSFVLCGCTDCKEGGTHKACTSKECAKKAIARMISKTQEVITDEMISNAQKRGYTINEMLALASIIQLESGIDTKEMPNVSAVFHNRLKNTASFPRLGSSPTIYYDKSCGGDGRYDTQNNRKGLPPGPICASGAAAIKAAFMPSGEFEFTYFVTDSDGNFYYNTTDAGHRQTIKQLQSQGKWIYEYY